MALDTDTNVDEIQGRKQVRTPMADAEDISGGVTANVGSVKEFTIFLEVGGSIEVTVEFSPDGGATWFEPVGESPITFSGANTDLVHVSYVADRVRLTGNNGTAVTAEIREVA